MIEEIKRKILEEFLEDRKKVLVSGKYEYYVEFCKKYDVQYTDNIDIFEIALHKSRVNCTDLPIELINESKVWLLNNGYSLDLGDNNE